MSDFGGRYTIGGSGSPEHPLFSGQNNSGLEPRVTGTGLNTGDNPGHRRRSVPSGIRRDKSLETPTTRADISPYPTGLLPKEHVGNLFSALGNNPVKAIVFLAMKSDDIIYTQDRLFEEVRALQADLPPSERVQLYKTVLFGYCKTLADIGLVTQEITEDGETFGYKVTKYGREVGEAFAGQSLKAFEGFPQFPLNIALGGTNSPAPAKQVETPLGKIEYKNRAPITNLKIYRDLLQSTLPMRIQDLMNHLSESGEITTAERGTIIQHCVDLGKPIIIKDSEEEAESIISLETIKLGEPFAMYSLASDTERPEGLPAPSHWAPTLSAVIYDIFLKNPRSEFSAGDVKAKLSRMNDLPITYFEHTSDVLAHFARANFLKQGKFTEECRSIIYPLSPTARAFMSSQIAIEDAFRSGNQAYIFEGREIANAIRVDPARVTKILREARNTSQMVNVTPTEETGERIIAILQDNPLLSSSEINVHLQKVYGQRLTVDRLRDYHLKSLSAGGQIVAEKGIGNVYYWKIKDEE